MWLPAVGTAAEHGVPGGRVPRRHARYYRGHNGTELRTLTKAFGIRFDVLVYGNVRMGTASQGPMGAIGGGRADSALCLPAGWEIWHCAHPHQHGSCLHLHRRGELRQSSALGQAGNPQP